MHIGDSYLAASATIEATKAQSCRLSVVFCERRAFRNAKKINLRQIRTEKTSLIDGGAFKM